MANIDMSDFYKNYQPSQIEKVKSIIDKYSKEVNDSNVLNIAGELGKNGCTKYPELQYYRINLLLNAGKINKAYNIACNFTKFRPIKAIKEELEVKLVELDPERVKLIENIITKFHLLCPEVDMNSIHEVIDNFNYEDAVELNRLINYVYDLKDNEKIADYTKSGSASHFCFIQYLRIRSLMILGKDDKAMKLKKTAPNISLFNFLNSDIIKVENNEEPKEEKIEIIDAVDEREITSILFTKLYVDNLSLEEINNAQIADFLKVIFTLAYYDKHSHKMGMMYLKEKIKYYKSLEKDSKVKVLNSLLPRFYGKNKLVQDLGIYQEILRVKIKFDKLDEYRKKEDIETNSITKNISIEPKKEEPIIIKEPKKEEIKSRFITSNDVVVRNNIVMNNDNHYKEEVKTPKIVESKKITTIPKEEKVKTIRELLHDDIETVELALYRETANPARRQDALRAWNILDGLVSKSIDDKKSLNTVLDFLSRIDGNNMSSIDLGLNLPSTYKKI